MKKQITFFVFLLAMEVYGLAQSSQACPVFGQIVASRLTSMSSFRVKVYDFAQHTRAAMLSVAVDGSFTGPEVPVGLYTITVLTIRDEQIVEQMVQITPGCTPITLRLPEESGSQPPSGAVSLTHLSHHVPSRALKAFERAQQEARSGDRAASFAHLQDALAADPDFFEARVNLGAAYMARNEPKQASDQFAYAVRLDSSSAPAWTNLAFAQLRTGEGVYAEESARHALRFDPLSVGANYALAVSWVMQRRFAQPILSHLQPAYSKYPHAHIVAAEALAGVGKLAEARAEVETYLQSTNIPDRAQAEEFLQRLQ